MSIRKKLIILFLAIAIVPLLVIGTLSFFNAREALRQSVLSGLHVIAEFKEGEVFLYLEKLKTRTVDFASDGFIRDSLEKIENQSSGQNFVEALNTHLLKNKKFLDKYLLNIDILNLQGIVVASTLSERIGVEKRQEHQFMESVKGVVCEGYLFG